MNKIGRAVEKWQDRRVVAAINAGCGRRKALAQAKARRKDIAEAIGVTEVTLFNWVNGHTTPNANKLAQLAALLGCDVGDLIDDG